MISDPNRERGPEGPVVLVVDDEASARAAYVRVLERALFRTCEAADGSEALRLLTDHAVDAVILDQRMPSMTGIEFIAAIRLLPLHDRTPVMFVSGDGSPGMRIRALRAGATDFMVKPVVLAELVARVEAQVRMSVTWQSTLQTLSRRAETVAALAEPSSTSGPTMTAAILCERISRAHDGAPVAVYESRSDGTQIPLASIGAQPRFLSTAAGRPSMRLRQQVRGSAWVEHERARTAMGEGGIW